MFSDDKRQKINAPSIHLLLFNWEDFIKTPPQYKILFFLILINFPNHHTTVITHRY